MPNSLRRWLRKLRASTTGAAPVVAVPQVIQEQPSSAPNDAYAARLQAERNTFDGDIDVHQLPEIYHYWSNKYLRPMCEEFGFSHPDDFFQLYLRKAAERTASKPVKFLSIGAGNCDTEVRVALMLKSAGLTDFTIECLELSPAMLARGKADAEAQGVVAHLRFTETDFNRWRADQQYDAVMANQSLHHVLELEHLYDQIKAALHPQGLFITSDMIGRNGHMRWPEALSVVQEFWQELPASHRYNLQLRRHEERYDNWDCSSEGFEGIRAQDVLPELIKRFHFELFVGFANVVDIFIDRSFGHHLDPNKEWDRDFVDRLHAYDEAAFANGTLTPTHMMAVMTRTPTTSQCSRGLSPERSVRKVR